MAILPKKPGIKISIICNGAPLQEYEDDDEELQPGTVSRYIEAISGAEFAVKWEISPPWPQATILFEYWLDHKKVSSSYCKQVYYRPPVYINLKEGASTVVNGQAFVHKFAFAALDVVDAGVALSIDDQLMRDIKGLGEITVKAWFVKHLETSVLADRGLGSKLEEMGRIPEKALKGRALTHQTSLRAPQASGKALPSASCEFLDPAKRPFATYTFKYRSREALKSLLIIPRTPSPVPLEERNVETLSLEEMRELLRRQREHDAATPVVKQERGGKREYTRERSSTCTDDAGDDISVVSTKRRREHYRVSVDENGIEEVDLT